MRTTFAIALLFAGARSVATAQGTATALDSARVAITQLTDAWNTAIVQRDSLALENLLAPDYSLNGMVLRTAWMDNTLHHLNTDTLEVLGALDITLFDQVAHSEGNIHWSVSFDARPKMDADFTVVDIWTRQSGTWKVMLRMASAPRMR